MIDIVGEWTEVKLEIIRRYAQEYTRVFKKFPYMKKAYIDAFSGPGKVFSKKKQGLIQSSPLIALSISPKFTEYFFIDKDHQKIEFLRKELSTFESTGNVHVYEDDCNKTLLNTLLPSFDRGKYKRALCILDPYGIELDWNVVRMSGSLGTIDLIIHFSIMSLDRFYLPKNPEECEKKIEDQMRTFWGDESWKDTLYTKIFDLYGGYDYRKKTNEQIVEVYKNRLVEIAGFKFVPDPIPMRNSKGSDLYYLFFASQKEVACRIATHIFEHIDELMTKDGN